MYTKTKSTIFTNTLTDRTRTNISPRGSRKMVKSLLWTAWLLATTKDYERKFTENRHIPTDYWTSHRTTRSLTRLQLYGLNSHDVFGILILDITRRNLMRLLEGHNRVIFTFLDAVVQKLDCAIQQINRYSVR